MTTALRILIILKNTFKLYKSRNFDKNRIKSNKYRLRIASNVFSFLFCCVAIVWFSQCECGAFQECSLGVHRMFATYWFSVCYILIIQKHGFCNAKVWFLACKSMVFAMQEVGFWNSNTGLLQNVDVQIMGYNSMAGYLFRGLNNCN